MKKILFVNHTQQRCGVYQYGNRLFNILKKSKNYEFILIESDNASDFFKIYNDIKPDGVVFNYHGITLKWVDNEVLSNITVKKYKVDHESPGNLPFDYIIEHEIISNKLGIERPIFEDVQLEYKKNDILTFGSFGFGFKYKGFENVCATINNLYDEAIIRLNITFPFYSDPNGHISYEISQSCRSVITKPNINLIITHDFLSELDILNFMSNNDMNLFFYENANGRGLSSVMDYALSIDRPVAITKSHMFRHVFDASPSIFVEDLDIDTILKNGTEPIKKLREKFSNKKLINTFENILNNTL